MSKPTERRCGTCQFSRWELTPTGRIKREAGQCVVTFIEPLLPACITKPLYHRHYIWPDGGGMCPLWQEREGGPQKRTAEECAKL